MGINWSALIFWIVILSGLAIIGGSLFGWIGVGVSLLIGGILLLLVAL